MALASIDVMIAGAQKAGTSTLGAWVASSPDVGTHHGLEFPYYVDRTWHAQGYVAAYQRAFGDHVAAPVTLAKSAGVMYVPGAAEALLADHPGCRLVVVLRHPVDRAYSAYWYFRRTGRETAPTFAEALAAESSRLAADPETQHLLAYRGRSQYLPQLERLWVTAGPEGVLVLLFEDLVRDPGAAATRVTRWLGVADPDAEAPGGLVGHNGAARPRNASLARWLRQPPPVARAAVQVLPPRWRNRWREVVIAANETAWRPPPLGPDARAELCAQFAPGVHALAAALGRDLSSWCR